MTNKTVNKKTSAMITNSWSCH